MNACNAPGRGPVAEEMHLCGTDAAGQIALAYELALARPIDAERLKDATAFVSQQTAMHRDAGKRDESAKFALADLCHVLMNSNEFVYVD